VLQRILDQRFEDCGIHVRQLLDVKAALAGRVFPQFRQQWEQFAGSTSAAEAA